MILAIRVPTREKKGVSKGNNCSKHLQGFALLILYSFSDFKTCFSTPLQTGLLRFLSLLMFMCLEGDVSQYKMECAFRSELILVSKQCLAQILRIYLTLATFCPYNQVRFFCFHVMKLYHFSPVGSGLADAIFLSLLNSSALC